MKNQVSAARIRSTRKVQESWLMSITVMDPSRRIISIVIKVVRQRKTIAELTSSTSFARIGKPTLIIVCKVTKYLNRNLLVSVTKQYKEYCVLNTLKPKKEEVKHWIKAIEKHKLLHCFSFQRKIGLPEGLPPS